MQSAQTNGPQQVTTTEIFEQTSNTPTQHGILDHDHPGLPLSFNGDDARLANLPDSARKHVQSSPFFDIGHGPEDASGLNLAQTPPRNKITDYENAHVNSTQKGSRGPLFEVVRKRRGSNDKNSPISELPNEVLTHTLSHLSPSDLSAVALVSHRFHDLVTTPHAWRIAFSRYFLGAESLVASADASASTDEDNNLRSDRRQFTRLTALASWRSEYILRTRLLRSLNRGKPSLMTPMPGTPRSGHGQAALAMVMYNSQLFTTVNHIHASWGTGINKRPPRFIHGADDMGISSTSDPLSGKTDPWGLSDPHTFFQFSDAYPGDAQWGLGSGDIVGCPNVMDVSQSYGMIYGEGHPNATLYHRGIDEMRGRFLTLPTAESELTLGIPSIPTLTECICSVWLAKSPAIPSLTDGLVGMMSGSSAGVLSAYSLGSDGMRGHRLSRGEATARWVLSPGVPIISIVIDESYSINRQAQNRIWAFALNALGEVFYLTKFPKRMSSAQKHATSNEEAIERLAWATGRSTYWTLVEPSRRIARPNPYSHNEVDGSYSPRSSWDGMCLGSDQIRAETAEIESFLTMKPKDFQKSCLGWDMRRRLEVDFAGDGGNYAGESAIVFRCGLDESSAARIDRYTRCKVTERENVTPSSRLQSSLPTPPPEEVSLFGDSSPASGRNVERGRRTSHLSIESSPERRQLIEEWRHSELSLKGFKNSQLTSTAIDCSTYATLTTSEDPTLGFSTRSNASSPFGSPQSSCSQPASPADIPGQRSRLIAAGTKSGVVIVWDSRAPTSNNAEFINVVNPVRVIYTDSPEISCLALTALYLVHGGNDGLVQAWDVLASQTQPIRTLHSRFSQRARRRLIQNQARPQGVGINLFAAGAVCLDPDPTILRGLVSLGTHLRYWSYSSSTADAYKSSKRRLRRSERGSNNGGERFIGRSSNLKDYIASEKIELLREEQQRQKEAKALAGRFGVDLLDNEEEALAYAALLSQEAFANEEAKRQTQASVSGGSVAVSSATVTPEPSVSGEVSSPLANDQIDADLAEAIRLSLQDSAPPAPPTFSNSSSPIESSSSPIPSAASAFTFDIPVKYAKAKRTPGSSRNTPKGRKSPPSARTKTAEGSSNDQQMSDLEFALQLSLAEENSRIEAEAVQDDFPALPPGAGNGKGKGRA